MAKDKADTRGMHRLDRVLDSLDHFENEEEEALARKGQRLTDKFRHLQPDYEEEETEFF